MTERKELYKRIKILGMLTFIPFVLAAGPLSGYFLGNYLQINFGFRPYLTFILIALGFFFSLREVITIIRRAISIDRG